jgi:hypothetical protein
MLRAVVVGMGFIRQVHAKCYREYYSLSSDVFHKKNFAAEHRAR